MKNLSICSFLLVVLAFGCKKEPTEEPAEPPYYVGTAKWEMNAENWNGVASAIMKNNNEDSTYDLHIFRNSASLNLKFKKIKLQTDKQVITPCTPSNPHNCPYADLYYGVGDVFYDAYRDIASNSIENYIEITALDLKKKTAKGKFQVVMGLEFPNVADDPNPSPDTLVLLNGSFETLIKN